MSQNNMTIVRKEEDFEAFLKLLEDNQFDTWEMVAKTLGVHPNTITNWKQHPLARKAISQGINNAIKQMELVGKRDWRMWREKVALLTRENEKNNEQPDVTNNLIILSDEELARYVYELVKRSAISRSSGENKDKASGGEGEIVTDQDK